VPEGEAGEVSLKGVGPDAEAVSNGAVPELGNGLRGGAVLENDPGAVPVGMKPV